MTGRDWMSAQEVKAVLRVTQPRISQLVKQGTLVADSDGQGRYKYDRASVERYASKRARAQAESEEDASERAVFQAEARSRLRRERDRALEEKERREKRFDGFAERAVMALEKIAACLQRY